MDWRLDPLADLRRLRRSDPAGSGDAGTDDDVEVLRTVGAVERFILSRA